MAGYERVIGLEVHVELNTKSKIFCGCTTEYGGAPNTHCCPVCTGMPGTLPVLNKKVVEYAMAVGLAMNCTITKLCQFDRKNYFYPDLPKAYQVSQLYLPICRNGEIEIEVNSQKKKIGIHEIHMEEDAGKLIHNPLEDSTLIDYNRSGVPLIEIVTRPDMRSNDEVIAFLEKLKLILQYLGVSDCKMQEGSLRADINLSVRKVGTKKLGTRTEMKNLNSFKAIARAIEGESKRQIKRIEEGKVVFQETRRWDDEKNTSISMRSKEDAKDYRYFPDPDLAPILIRDEWLEKIRKKQPELQSEKAIRYQEEYNLPEYDIHVITNSKYIADLFEKTTVLCNKPKEVSNWIMTDTMRLLREKVMEPEDITFHPKNLAKLIQLIEEGSINRTIGREVFEIIFDQDMDPERYIQEKGLGIVNDEKELKKVIENIIKSNPKSVSDYKNGKEKAIRYLIGQTMKAMKGKANPDKVIQLLEEWLQ